VRIPWYHEAACVLEPQGVVMVPAPIGGRIVRPSEYAIWFRSMRQLEQRARESMVPISEPGESGRLAVDPQQLSLLAGMPEESEYAVIPRNGSPVESRAVLAVMESPDDLKREDELRRRVSELVLRTENYERYRNLGDDSSASDSLAEILELEQVIRELVKLNPHRVVRAPTGGVLVAARRIPEQPKSELDQMKLSSWNGTPLDPRNAGCSLEAGQEITSIAPSDKLQAVLYIDQTDRGALPETGDVQIKLEHLPQITWLTRVTLLSPKGEVIAPESLTTRFGGSMATRPGQSGQEQLASTAYRAIAELHFADAATVADAALMKPGMRGHARFMVQDRTLVDWASLYFFETFRFRL
jgi:hypothetical protein